MSSPAVSMSCPTGRKSLSRPLLHPLIRGVALAIAVALSLPARAADPAVERARDELARGNGIAAQLLLKERLSQDPGDGDARVLLGEAYLRAEDFPAAEKEFQRAGDLGLAPLLWQPGLIAVRLGQGQLEQAGADLDALVAADPVAATSPRVQLLRAQIALARGEPDAAEAGFRAVLASGEEQAEARLGLVRLADTYGSGTGPEADLDAFLRDFPGHTGGLLLAADRARDQGDMAKARELFARARDGAPENLVALAGLAAADLALGEFAMAEETLVRMERLRQNMPITAYLVGLSRFLQGQFDAALEPLNRVIAVAPGDPRARLLVAAIDYQKGRFRAAAEHLRIAVAAQPQNRQARKLLAVALLKDNNPREAIRVLEDAGPNPPPDITGLLGTAWAALGDRERGTELLRQAATAADPRTASVIQTQIAQIAEAAGRPDDALVDLEAAAAVPGRSPLADLALIGTQIRAGRLDAASAAAGRFEQANPQAPLGADVAGVVAALRGDAATARAKFEQALALDPDYLPAQINLARVEIAEEQYDAAAARLRAVLEREPGRLDALLLQADLARFRGDTDAVNHWLGQAVNAAPKAAEPRRRMIAWLLAQNRPTPALPHAQALVEAAPDSLDAWQLLARVQGAAGDREGLRRTVERLEAAADDNADWFFAAGLHKLGLGDLPGARDSFSRAIQRQPNHVRARLQLARVQQAVGEPQAALQTAAGLQQDFPEAPVGYQLAGQLLLANDRPQDALEPLTKAWDLDPTQRETLLLLAEARGLNGEPGEAAAVLARWLANQPTDAAVALRLALLRQEAGDRAGAIAVLEPAWQAGSQDPLLLNNLAWLLGEAGDPRAREVAARAYERQPADPAVADTYGWLLHQAGDQARALEVLTAAHEAAPGQPTIAYHLAAVLAASGRQREAGLLLEQTLLQAQRFDGSDEARALLQRLRERTR